MALLKERNMAYNLMDMRKVDWQAVPSSLNINGCYMKACIDGYYYKLPTFNIVLGFYGMESINEVIVYRLLKILGIACAEQKLIKALVKIDNVEYITYACKSRSYLQKGDTRLRFDEIYIRVIEERQ